MLRWSLNILKFAAVFVAVLALAVLLLLWHVASQPISSTALTPYVETALESLFPKTQAEIAATLIVWDNVDHSLALQGQEVHLRDSQGTLIAQFPVMKLKLSVLGLLQGRFIPSEMNIANPQLWFVRKEDGTVWFGGMGTGDRETPSAETLSVWDVLRHFTKEMTRVAGLHDLSITQATLSVHDEETLQDWAIEIPEISLHHGWTRLTGLAKIEVNQKDHDSLIEAHYSYERLKKTHNVKVQFQNINPSVLTALNPRVAKQATLDIPLTGEVSITTDHDLNIASLGGKIEGGAGTLLVPDLWDKPRPVKAIKGEGRYDRLTGRLEMPQVELDFDGPRLSIKIEGEKPPVKALSGDQQASDMAFSANIQLTGLPINQYGAVWPKPIIPDASEWIVASLSKGQFTQGDVTVKGRFVWNNLENMVVTSAAGKIAATGATVNYLEGMPPVEGVNADAAFDLDHMDVQVTSGNVGALKVVPFTIQMTDFQTNVQNIVIPLKLTGPAPDVIKLIDAPPLGYAKAVGLRAEDCEGNVEGTVELRFPLLKTLLMQDVAIKANAQLTDFGAHKLVPGIDISQGNLTLTLDKEKYALKGPASLNKVPLQISWESRFGEKEKADVNNPKSKAVVSGVVNGHQWKQLGVDLTDKIKDSTAVTLQYIEISSSLAQMSGDLDFRHASVDLGEIGWKKPVGKAAILKFIADLPSGKDIQVKSIELLGEEIKARGTARLDRTTQRLLVLDLQPLVLGRTNANLHFMQTLDDKGELRISVDGESFDASGLTGGEDPVRADPRSKDYTLRLVKLYTSENGFMDNVQVHARRDSLGWSEIDLHGLADGIHQLDISLAVLGGKRTFSATCNDFGKALKGMGFTDTVRDGPIEIKGESLSDNPRVIEGTVKIGHFVVAGLPVLARLLSAASPFGFVDFVTGNASFDHLEGQFRWQQDTVDLMKVRAVGSVFGLNIDGRLDLNTGESNLHGTMVPFSLFNRLINVIPLLGDVITGGEGEGVLAVAYSVEGNLSDPDISVNPISLLTPGFLRNLFFGGDDLPPVSTPKQEGSSPDATPEIDKKP